MEEGQTPLFAGTASEEFAALSIRNVRSSGKPWRSIGGWSRGRLRRKERPELLKAREEAEHFARASELQGKQKKSSHKTSIYSSSHLRLSQTFRLSGCPGSREPRAAAAGYWPQVRKTSKPTDTKTNNPLHSHTTSLKNTSF